MIDIEEIEVLAKAASTGTRKAKADYISAVKPQTILELIARLKKAEAKIKKYGKGSEALCKHFGVD